MSDSTPDNVTPIDGPRTGIFGEEVDAGPIPFGEGSEIDEIERAIAEETEAARLAHRARTVAGLRELADMYESRPDLPIPEQDYIRGGAENGYGLPTIYASTSYYGADAGEKLAAAAKALGKADKDASGETMIVRRELAGGAVVVSFTAPRDAVCRRVVKGTEIVEVPRFSEAIAAVQIGTVEVEREIVEWECEPLLSKGGES